MALVRSNNQRNSGWNALNQALYSYITGGGPVNPYALASDAGKVIGDKIKDAVARNQPKQGGSWADPGGNSGARRSGNNPRRRRGRENRQKLTSGDTFRQIGIGPTTGLPSVRVRLTGVFDAATGPTGTYSHSAQYMMGYYGGTALFKKLNADAQKLFDAFEKATVHSVSIKFVGTVSSTAAGHVIIGMDSSTDASDSQPQNTAGGIADKCTHVVICDVKGEGSLTYRPKGTDKECRTKDAVAADSEKYCGKLYHSLAGSTVAVSTTYGLFQLTVDVTLHQ